MASFSRLHDLCSFPGFVPAATIRGVFGDPYAVVITLRRRRKKPVAACAGPVIAPSTTKPLEGSGTSIVADDGSSWKSSSDASSVATAKP
jgi:hypothetical protein